MPRFSLPRLVLIGSFALSIASQANAQQKQFPINFVSQFKQGQDHRLEADKKLIENMDALADYLMRFRHRHGHFPEVGVEEERATSYAQKSIMKQPNPYTVTAVASAEESKAVCPLRFVHDIGLIDSQRQEWEKKAPSDWRADPGTITIIMNEYDNIVIWGASADHMPVYDGKNNRVYIASRSAK